jgi:hypothetical protein
MHGTRSSGYWQRIRAFANSVAILALIDTDSFHERHGALASNMV